MLEMTVAAFQDRCKRLYDSPEKVEFKCPNCGGVQCGQDFIDAKVDIDWRNVVGFSCIGRWVEGRGCNWTLGGLLKIHKMEVVDEERIHHPHFEFANDEDLH